MSRRKDRTLDGARFGGLLTWLDRDPGAAAGKYEEIRRKLIRIFEWRGSPAAEEHADETFDRLAQRIAGGSRETIRDQAGFIHGIAMNVLREYWRSPGARTESLADSDPAAPEVPNSPEEEGAEARLQCFQACLGKLPAEAQRLVKAYHRSTGGEKIRERRTLAAELRIPLNALRIRVHRLRVSLEACVTACEKEWREKEWRETERRETHDKTEGAE